MVQRVTVTVNSDVSLKSLLASAVDAQAKMLALGMQRTRERLQSFERRFDMSSAIFERRFSARELEESLDFIEWLGEIRTLRLLEDQRRALEALQIN